MMIYLDTSSLVKLYINEIGSLDVVSLVSEASAVITSIVAYPETRSAFARQHKDGQLTKKELTRIKNIFEDDWKRYLIISITEDISYLAGNLAEKYALRGFDAIHLASYLSFMRKIRKDIKFSSFDNKLNKAADDVIGN